MWRFRWFEAFSADASAAVKVTVASPQVPLKTAEPKTSDSWVEFYHNVLRKVTRSDASGWWSIPFFEKKDDLEVAGPINGGIKTSEIWTAKWNVKVRVGQRKDSGWAICVLYLNSPISNGQVLLRPAIQKPQSCQKVWPESLILKVSIFTHTISTVDFGKKWYAPEAQMARSPVLFLKWHPPKWVHVIYKSASGSGPSPKSAPRGMTCMSTTEGT